ncbi:MAG: lactonase family protein [Chloroflexi bacterium]|nr:lactonase family protein [Chloroflexota bacterium]MCI0795715.1 lactonase family protein [Chloroflexota bacterium]
MPYYMYITLSEEDRIAIYEMDPDSGDLQHRQDVSVEGRPAPLALHPSKRYLYAAQRDINMLSSFAVDQSTGSLSLIGQVSLVSDPCYLGIDRKGNYLLSAYYGAGKCAVHPIGDDGAVGGTPTELLDTANGAHCMQTDRSNRFAFLPHIAGGTGPNAIYQYLFDEDSGKLTPNNPATVNPESQVGPRHYCFHPSKDILYFSNEQGSSVTGYHLDVDKGTLEAFQTISTLPDGYAGKNSCAQIQIAPSGRFLYAPNRGHNSMACFALDAETGRLTSLGQVPAEAIPRAFSLDPQGKFLYSAGLESGRLAAYSIDQSGGRLSPIRVYDVGKAPMWVLITEL